MVGVCDYSNKEDLERAIRKLDRSYFRNPFDEVRIRVRADRGRSPSASRSRSYSRSYSRSVLLNPLLLPAHAYLPVELFY